MKTRNPSHELIEAAKRQSTAQLLFRVSRLTNERAIESMRKMLQMPGLRTAHTSLFPHIDHDGTRQTVIAQRLGISKQAVAQLVDELVEMGSLERVPDPSDGRAKLVRFRPGVLLSGLAHLGMMERELAMVVGPERFDTFHQILVELLHHLEPPDGEDPQP